MRNMLVILVALQILTICECQITCDQQLRDVYDALGYTNGNIFNTVLTAPIQGGIEITLSFEYSANLYQATTPSLSNLTRTQIPYISLDYPWCVDSLELVCGAQIVRNAPKTALCDIIDYDVDGELNAGRLLITRGDTLLIEGGDGRCGFGNVIIRMFGDINILPFGTTGIYTYSSVGLPYESRNLTSTQAIIDYQRSLCREVYNSSAIQLSPGQTQHVCGGPKIGCNTVPRPFINTDNLTPFPTYACRGVLSPGGPVQMVWFVTALAQRGDPGQITFFGINFCNATDAACLATPLTENLPIRAGTRTQVFSNYTDFKSVQVFRFENKTSFTRPIYPFAVTDPFIRDIPCICGLSMDCTADGLIDLRTISKQLKPNNRVPVVNATTPVFVLVGQQSVKLDACASFDPDNAPNTLTYYWKQYNASNTPFIVIIGADTCSPTIAANFLQGTYTFIVYVSDGQQVVFGLVNVTAELDIIRVIIQPTPDIQWRRISVCPSPPGQLPDISLATPLNGSASFSANPNVTLTYKWTQTAGSNITVPFECDPASVDYFNVEAFFNTDQPIAYVVFPALGLYCFRLTISDGGVSPTRFQETCISVESKFNRPNSTQNNYTDYPDAPSFNTSNGSVPTVSFQPTPQPPTNDLTRSPSPPSATVPSPPPTAPYAPPAQPIFPQLPPPSSIELALLFMAFVAMVATWISLLGYCLAFLPYDYENSRWDRIAVYG